MLGSPTRSLDEIYERLEALPFVAEFKYDGQRAQIHALRQDAAVQVKMFSRHLEDMTDKARPRQCDIRVAPWLTGSQYPDVVALVTRICDESKAASFIMDAEVVAIDPRDGSIKTFQELSNRARKDVKAADVTVAVCIFAFDLMYLDGRVRPEPSRLPGLSHACSYCAKGASGRTLPETTRVAAGPVPPRDARSHRREGQRCGKV